MMRLSKSRGSGQESVPAAASLDLQTLKNNGLPAIQHPFHYGKTLMITVHHLNNSEWFAGPAFTAADIQMSFAVEAAAQRAGLDATRPKLMAFLKRIHARPAYRRALERGGPYAFVEG